MKAKSLILLSILTFFSATLHAEKIGYGFENKNELKNWFIKSSQDIDAPSKKEHFKTASGNHVLSTLYKSGKAQDHLNSTIYSPIFNLKGPIKFKLSAGNHKGTFVGLYTANGKLIKEARGQNSLEFTEITWDPKDYYGKAVELRLVDTHQGNTWAFVTIDDLVVNGSVNTKLTKQRNKKLKRANLVKKVKEETNIEALGKAIVHMTKTYPSYPRTYYKKFSLFKSRFAKSLQSEDIDPQILAEFKEFKKEALLANPLLTAQPLLINVREQFWGSHCPHGTMFQNGEDSRDSTDSLRNWRGDGGHIKILSFTKDGKIAKNETLISSKNGVIRDPEVHFDGQKILISLRENKEDDYNIYEIDLKTKNKKQITWGKEFSDVDPIYLPNGKVAFSSTREPKYCQCNMHIQPNLFVTEADGANTIQISRNNLADFHGTMMPDGRIMYSRWEYVDRQFGPSLGLWTCNPDGTQHQLFMGNNSWTPGAMLDAKPIPGTNKVVTIYGSTHDRPWGAMTVVDRTKGMDGLKPIVQMWPPEAISRIKEATPEYTRDMRYRGEIDSTVRMPVKYEDPYPLHNHKAGNGGGTYFLVSKTIGNYKSPYGGRNGYVNQGIYLVDTFGNETLVYSEPGQNENCYDPIPITSRKRPPVIANKVNLKKNYGIMYVQDVYIGTDDEMVNVKRGDIKYLRIMEAPPKRYWREDFAWNVDARQVSPMNWNLTVNKRILGDVPVEADGSAHFYVPADKFVHFLALDENKQMIQAMRTGTMVRPGEVQGCVGCHENRVNPPKIRRRATLAYKRKPSQIEPWLDYKSVKETPAFNYLTEVQPVFDKNCVSCHDYDKAEGGLNLAGDVGMVFNQSYIELMRKSRVRYDGPREVLVSAVHDGPPGVLPAYSWGSHKSTLIKTLKKGHHNVKLSDEEMQRIVTWIDINSVYYGAYQSAYGGRIPLDHSDRRKLLQLAGVRNIQGEIMRNGELVSFVRPEKSRILKKFEKGSDKYNQILALIKKGQQNLIKQPREDQAGSNATRVWEPDIYRDERVKRNEVQEQLSREAILSGRKHYQYKD